MSTTEDERLQEVDLVPYTKPRSDDYSYQPLPAPDWIRLLIISPSAVMDAPFACAMEAVPSQRAAEYCALSYSWGMNKTGDASLTRTIKIGNAVKPVTQNLFEALRRLRSAEIPVTLWVDAVCIDQRNPRERTEQVARMASVYKNASRVVLWLGEGESADNDAAVVPILKCMQHEQTHAPRDDHTWTCPGLGQTSLCKFNAHSRSDNQQPRYAAVTRPLKTVVSLCWAFLGNREQALNKLNQSLYHAVAVLEDMFCRRYFSRRWIVQEIWHADRAHTYVLWGAESLPLSQFQELISRRRESYPYCYERFSLPPVDPFDKTRWKHRCHDVILRSVNLSLLLASSDTTPTLPQWLAFCGTAGLECSDPRDRVYSLVNLDDTFGVAPDYTKSTVEVYTNFARRLIECGRFDIILDNLYVERSRHLPSWVPDLDIYFDTPMYTSISYEKHVRSELQGLCLRTDENILTYCPFYIGTIIGTVRSLFNGFHWEVVLPVVRLRNPPSNAYGPDLRHQGRKQEITLRNELTKTDLPQIGDIICTGFAKIEKRVWDVQVLRPTKGDLCRFISARWMPILPPEIELEPEPLSRITVRVE